MLCLIRCDPMDYSPRGSSVHGIFQARIPEWVANSSSRVSFQPRDQTSVSCVSCIDCRFFFLTTEPPRKTTCPITKWVKLLSHVRLCDPMNCSLPGSSVHGIIQARVLEWIAISFSRGSSWPRDWTGVSCFVGRCFTVRTGGEDCPITSTF